MKYYVFKGSTPYCGTDFEAYVAVGDEVTERELADYAEELAMSQVDNFEYMITGLFNENEYDEEDLERFRNDTLENTYWEEISEEEYKAESERY
jgi:hypothetical protein